MGHLKYTVNADGIKSIDLLLYGGIGSDIDGERFAQEINYLDKEDFSEIVVRINSAGGNVFQGLSIFNALLNAKAFITIKIDGIAASMGGVIAMSGDHIQMNDFSRLMVHNPSFANSSKRENKALGNIKDVLSAILSRRGFDQKEMNNLMEDETWLTAQEALKRGLIDEVMNTKRQKEVENIFSGVENYAEIVNELDEILKPKNKLKMKEILNFLGLAEGAKEDEILNKIKALQSSKETLTDENGALKETIERVQKEKIAAIVNTAIEEGRFKEEAKDSLIEVGIENEGSLNSIIENAGISSGENSLTDDLQNDDGEARKDKADQFEDFRKDPQALQELKDENSTKFNDLQKAWEKKYC